MPEGKEFLIVSEIDEMDVARLGSHGDRVDGRGLFEGCGEDTLVHAPKGMNDFLGTDIDQEQPVASNYNLVEVGCRVQWNVRTNQGQGEAFLHPQPVSTGNQHYHLAGRQQGR